MSKLIDIEGIDDTIAESLKTAGISSIEQLLAAGADKKGRKELAANTGLPDDHILNWLNRADLSRVNGISTQYSNLLELSGVDTVPELAQRNAENLHKKMTEINADKSLVKKVPALSQVEDWVSQAKALPRAIFY